MNLSLQRLPSVPTFFIANTNSPSILFVGMRVEQRTNPFIANAGPSWDLCELTNNGNNFAVYVR